MKREPGKVQTTCQFVYTAFAFLILSAAESTGYAQSITPHVPTDSRMPFSFVKNPALLSQHKTQISFGIQGYQLGFLENNAAGMKESRFAMSLPFLLPFNLAAGAALRQFDALIYAELEGNLLISKKLYRTLSFGINVGFETQGFSQNRFSGVDMADPLLNGQLRQTFPTAGIGLLFDNDKLKAGFGVSRIIRPRTSPADRIRQPIEFSAALGMRWQGITPTLVYGYDGFEHGFGAMVTARAAQLGDIRLISQQNMPVKIEASLNFSSRSIFGYGVDLPAKDLKGQSWGSHYIYYTHIISDQPELGLPEILLSTHNQNQLDTRVYRKMPAQINIKGLAQPELEAHYFRTDSAGGSRISVAAGRLLERETRVQRILRYKKLHQFIARLALFQPDAMINIRATSATRQDALALQDVMLAGRSVKGDRIIIDDSPPISTKISGFRPGKTMVSEHGRTYSSPYVTIRLAIEGKSRIARKWQLLIQDAQGGRVKSFVGTGKIPETLVWDWKTETGTDVPPGEYTCRFRALSNYNNMRHAKAAKLHVTRTQRTVTLEFKSKIRTRTKKRHTLTSKEIYQDN